MLDLIGINLYLGTDRLLRPRGGRGFSEKCGVTKLPPPPPTTKKLHMEIVPPLVITIFKMQPLPHPPPSPLPPKVHAGEETLARQRRPKPGGVWRNAAPETFLKL